MTDYPTKPERYVVTRIGTPDPPDSSYYVLNLTYDFEARVALAKLGRNYENLGMTDRAKELFAHLEATTPLMAAMHEKRDGKQKKKSTTNKQA